MYVRRDEGNDLIKNMTENIFLGLEEKHEFLFALLEEDDWSMIIKSHALIESMLTELIVSRTEESELKVIVERLPISDSQIGKLSIAKEYKLLSKEQRAFIRRLSELRNWIVHKFENIDFRLDEYVTTLDGQQVKSWKNVFTWYAKDAETKLAWSEATIQNTKVAIWFSIFMFVSLMLVEIGQLNANTELNMLAFKTTKEILGGGV